ncbi:hypothetical protein [Porphyromonas sp.]|uniref:hypothetical protein n=1 Tax=Porphyromonas sp. TaxID=1924944 RepID=UPI0025D7D4B4|nr:hypothetical protein [Porphyromonas sp.]
MMADLDFEQLDRNAIQYLRNHLDPSFIKEYDDDEIFLYVMDLCDEYSEGMDDEEGFLDLDEIASFVSDRLSKDMGVKMHEDDAYDLISTLYDYYAEEGLVDVIDADEEQK